MDKKISEQQKDYYQKNREKIRKRQKEYYNKNKEKILERHHENQKNPEHKLKRKESNRRYREKTKDRKKAHKKVENAIKFGKIERQPCEVCGDPNSQAHHDDYTKPLDVRWLCQPHHREAHED